MDKSEEERIENDWKREYEEYLERIAAEPNEQDYDELNTGIKAIDMAYFLGEKRVKLLVDIFNKAINYIEEHTDLTKDEIKERINQTIREIELVEDYPDNPYGVGYVQQMFSIMSINSRILKENPGYIYEFIKHEMTHMIGSCFVNRLFKSMIQVTGYARENVFDADSKAENEMFNEAATEMFISQDEEYKEEKVLNYTINTNQNVNGGLYCLNSNLIHQMILARGISEQEFFKGLYDYKKSKQVIGKFRRSIFKTISSNMDVIYDEMVSYYQQEDEIDSLQKENTEADVSKQREKMAMHKAKVEEAISLSERMIIDKILLPRLKRLPLDERQQLLSEYEKFIISEREYFVLKTGYKAVAVVPTKKQPWIQHIDVEPLNTEEIREGNTKFIDRSKGEAK